MPQIDVDSPHVQYKDDVIISDYKYQMTSVSCNNDKVTARPREINVTFCTKRRVPQLGVMLVGWGGNNGTTITAAVLANKLGLQWHSKHGLQSPNYYGSITQSSSVWLGGNGTKDVFVPMRDLLPLVHPNDIVFDGWDLSSLNLADAMERAKVLDYALQQQLRSHMEKMMPRRSPYYKDFIAANQSDRADNVLDGSKSDHVQQIREDIRDFKQQKQLDKVIVLWTANTERFSDTREGLNDTADNLLQSIDKNEDEVSMSTVFAVASILEGCCYINGSPQNTFVPGVIDLAEKKGVFIGGDDLKTGQTKLKSVIIDFLVSAGIKPSSIVSYNHLGNNDGMNLSAPEQFRSKEITKRTVVDDMVDSNKILYPNGEKPDHCIVIKYVPFVGDSKRALDEYSSELMLGGRNTIVMHDTCEDSLLAAPVILDLIILAELCQRISLKVNESDDCKGKASKIDEAKGFTEGDKAKDSAECDKAKGIAEDDKAKDSAEGGKAKSSAEGNKAKDSVEGDKVKDAAECCEDKDEDSQHFHSVLSMLSYMCKAPLVPPGTPVINALFRQRACIDNIMRACIGLAPINNMMLEHKIPSMVSQHKRHVDNECKP